MTEIKIALAERKKLTKKNCSRRFWEDYGYKYMLKKPQFDITLIFTKYCFNDLRPRRAKNFDFLSIPYSLLQQEHRKLNIKTTN